MCPVKGGATQQTVMDSVRLMMATGMTVYQAIVEVETILRGKLPEHIKALIYQDCK